MSVQPSLARLAEELRHLKLDEREVVMRTTPDGYRIYDGDKLVGELSRRISSTKRMWTWTLASSPRMTTPPVLQRDTAITLLLRAYAERRPRDAAQFPA